MIFDFQNLFNTTGISVINWQIIVMLLVGSIFIYLSIVRDMEPYELLPIGIGIIIGNLPLTGLNVSPVVAGGVQEAGIFGIVFHYGLAFWNILPPIIFLGIGALTDFGPLIASPKTLILGAAAQVGIFIAFWVALLWGFPLVQAASIGIIGGADGPTTIFLTSQVAPSILGITAVIAYVYMALVPFIQPPLAKLFTTQQERSIVMKAPRDVGRTEKIILPLLAMLLIILIVPRSAPLISMFMIGNIFKESGVVPRLADAASNEILNIATIFLMLTIGTQLSADSVFQLATIKILILGVVAFAISTVSGVLFAKLMNLFLREKINPLIGAAGVSAVPMAARIAHQVAQEENPNNYLLPHAMAPNVAGVIGSAVIAGVFLALLN
ncbi:MAG: glutaconyl-CoA decarboxylase subunit beta [Chloroflexota bacterium]|nr:MAG: glutaconyl-CoA decarboxylase subunit beta [Chloroflexota bacterium]